MILKAAGALLVVCASSLAGLYLSSTTGFQIHDLQEMKKALSILRSEIEYAAAPLPEALANISKRTAPPVSLIFRCASEMLTEKKREGIEQVWRQAIDMHRKSAYFDNEDIESLYAFGKTLGYLDKKLQIAAIGLTSDAIDAKVETLSAGYEKRRGMYRSLGFLVGVLVVILLL